MRIYETKQNKMDMDILANMFDLFSMSDKILNEWEIYQYRNPVHNADRKYFQISNTISDNFKLIGFPAYHKHGPVKIYMDAV